MISLRLSVLILLLWTGCEKTITDEEKEIIECSDTAILDNQADGCTGNNYPSFDSTDYVLPYPPGKSYPTGLTNCSASFHSTGKGDEYAYDFDMPNNSDFHAIRKGKIIKVVENHPNHNDGTAGNYLVVDHGDQTFALYYHSPPDGILFDIGAEVAQGVKLGVTGTSGYAGYPHLHLIVVKNSHEWPYEGIPISFKNVYPKHVVLKSNYESYGACEYE